MRWAVGQRAVVYDYKTRVDLQHATVVIEEWLPDRALWLVRVEATGELTTARDRMLFDVATEPGVVEGLAAAFHMEERSAGEFDAIFAATGSRSPDGTAMPGGRPGAKNGHGRHRR